jgi:hypothetical protein
MEMKEWIKEQQRRYLDEPRLKELTEVMKQTRVLVRKKEYRKLSELVRRYRKSEDVITQVSCLFLLFHIAGKTLFEWLKIPCRCNVMSYGVTYRTVCKSIN